MSLSKILWLFAALLVATTPVAAARDPHRSGRGALTVHRAAPLEAPVPAVPLDLAIGAGVTVRTPFTIVTAATGDVLVRVPHYQGPDGAYDEPADFVRSINGTPCGQACRARSLVRWGYAEAAAPAP